MAYGDFKDFAKRRASDKVLRDKAFNIAKDLKCDGYQRGLVSMVYKIFDTKLRAMVLNICHKMGNYLKRKVYSAFRDNIWCADLAECNI